MDSSKLYESPNKFCKSQVELKDGQNYFSKFLFVQ